MEKRDSRSLTSSLQNLSENPSNKTLASHGSPLGVGKTVCDSLVRSCEKTKCPSLVSLCLGVIGKHFEEIFECVGDVLASFPPDTKLALVAIAKRRKLLNDDVLISLADSSWDVLDLSGSNVSDLGLTKVSEMAKSLRTVDIRRCCEITAGGVSELVSNCRSLEILRCGGCVNSNLTARRSLKYLKPKLKEFHEDSWENLYSLDISVDAESLRWLVWPEIDCQSERILTKECPRILVNPMPSTRFGFRVLQVPYEALPDVTLDDHIIKDINPKAWEVGGVSSNAVARPPPNFNELPIAEKFRLAFVERAARLALKEAKMAIKNERLAEREWACSTEAKAVALERQVKGLVFRKTKRKK
ncbi:uncharacterized protein LOC113300007 [Papaver somniferum]|nr:uncharacterized protein LOC113300007 [Papaver somniferum]